MAKTTGWRRESGRHRSAYYKGTQNKHKESVSSDSRWEFSSRSRPGVSYTVELNNRGQLTCNCPSWVYNSRHQTPRTCKHTDDVVRRLGGVMPNIRPREAPHQTHRRRFESPVRVTCTHCQNRYDEDEVILDNIESNDLGQDVVTFRCPGCNQTSRSLRIG